MEFKIPSGLIIILATFVFCAGIVNAFDGVGILSADLDKEDDGVFSFESRIANYGEGVRANLTINYQILREKDGSLVLEESQGFSFAPREVKTVDFTFDLPEGMSDDDHVFLYQVLSTNEAPLAGGTIEDESLRGDSISIYLEKGPYIKFSYELDGQNIVMESHGTMGNNIKQGSEYDLLVELGGEYMDIKDDLWVNITHLTSYGGRVVDTRMYPLEELLEDGVISNSYLAEDSGTYRIVMSLLGEDGNLYFKDEVRAVVTGEDVSIIGAENSQDVYSEGETFDLSVDLVGPADGIGTFEGGFLELDILKAGELIHETKTDLDSIGVGVEKKRFEFTVPEDLEEYRVVVRATKNGEVYDKIVLDYEELVPEEIISEDGRVYDPNAVGCFDDGICTPQEREHGGCYDCYVEDMEKKDEKVEEEGIGIIWLIALSLFVICIIALGFVLFMRENKNGEK